LTPFVGGGIAYGTARLLRKESIPETVAVPALGGVVGLLVANIRFAVLGGESGRSLAEVGAAATPPLVLPVLNVELGVAAVSVLFVAVSVALVRREVVRDLAQGQRRFLLVLGGLVAFSAGGSQVGLAIGPLVPLLGSVSVPLPALLVGGGLGLLVGSWTGAPRMIKALSQDYSSLGPRRSIAAMIPSFAIAQTAVALGIPVSFNEIIVSAIIGSGYAAGGAGVSREKMLKTALAWVGSLALAFGVAYGAFTGLEFLL
jgi:PiT family inorganic phosphate transporter